MCSKNGGLIGCTHVVCGTRRRPFFFFPVTVLALNLYLNDRIPDRTQSGGTGTQGGLGWSTPSPESHTQRPLKTNEPKGIP